MVTEATRVRRRPEVGLTSENACGQTWPELRRELDRIHAGTFRQRTEITKPQAAILKALETSAPPRIYQLKPPVEE